ncbi:MAG TPA: hypothetical protein DCS93_13455 [Microscillaceae bacterium]|nr:hypothetical protein [Microscillaceae bacterium]
MKINYLICMLCLISIIGKAQQTNTPPAVGTWKIILKEDRELIKALKIYQQNNQWKALLGKTDLPVQYTQGKFIIDWKGKGAYFEGAFANNQQLIKGFWRQYQYVAPVKLTKTSQGWKGTREIQFKQLTIYLAIRKNKKTGELFSFIYNHERNQGNFIQITKVESKGNRVRLFGRNSKTPMFSGTFSKGGNILTMPINIQGMSGKVLRKVDPDKEVRARPRLGQKTYTYAQPKQINDGWETASLARTGANMDKIQALMDSILARKYFGLHSLVLVHNNQLVLDEYFYGHHREHLHDTRSAGKSLASTMIGLALDRNLLTNVDQKVVDLFPEYQGQIKNLDTRKKQMRIRDLMTMATGLACNDDDDKSPGNEGTMQDQTKQPDWVKYTLDLPMVREPGSKALYCTGGVNLLGQIVSNVSRQPTYEFLHKNLFEPLEIERYVMNTTPVNNGYLGGGIHMLPRDLAKFGQLFVNEGTWKGKRVISKKWVKEATKGHSTMNGAKYKNYGYNWWIQHYEVGGEKYKAFYASGNGGQLIFGVPKLNLVAVFNAGNYFWFGAWKHYIFDIMPNYIIPAIAKTKK